MFTKTFVHFVIGFLVIIGAAFAVLGVAGNLAAPKTVDNVASPQ